MNAITDNQKDNDMNIIEKNTLFSHRCELKDGEKEVDWGTLEFAVDDKMLKEEYLELFNAVIDKDEVNVLDGAYDVSVIALNIAYKLFRMKGFNHEQATIKTELGFHRVLDSNLSKIKPDGTVEYNGDKVAKPSTYFKPKLDDLLT